MAKLQELHVTLSRKTWNDKDGSLGVDVGVVLQVEEGEDKDELYAATMSWLSAKAGGTLKAHGAVSSQPEPVLRDAPPKAKTGPAPIIAEDEEVFSVDSILIEVMPDGETKTAKAKGGKWTKYGVKVWDEVLALPPLEWDLQELDVAEYGPPAGLTAIVLMVEGKPKKVKGWK